MDGGRARRYPPWVRPWSLRARLNALLATMLCAYAGLLTLAHASQGSRAMFLVVLLAGLAASLLVSALIARMVVDPLERLRDAAARWKLGTPWTLRLPEAAREIRELKKTMMTLTDALNQQYEREHRTNVLKSQMISAVSHEFNNALAVIHTAHVLLQESQPHDAETGPWHEMLESNISALSAMATNLLNLGRLESGEFRVETRRVEVAPMLHGALERLKLLGRRKSLRVRFECAGGLPPVSGDADALSLVVANLLTNAFKYTPEGGEVALGAAPRPDGEVEVYVRDTGIGVRPEEREKIFSGYYRTEAGKRQAKGFGVGLALSRMILEAHRSRLELESEPGKGSRFHFRLRPFDPKAVPAGRLG